MNAHVAGLHSEDGGVSVRILDLPEGSSNFQRSFLKSARRLAHEEDLLGRGDDVGESAAARGRMQRLRDDDHDETDSVVLGWVCCLCLLFSVNSNSTL